LDGKNRVKGAKNADFALGTLARPPGHKAALRHVLEKIINDGNSLNIR
jgi:hypothetical protein